MQIKTIIVEDDAMAMKFVETLAKKNGSLELLQSFSNPLHAMEFLKDNEVDLILLDIEMPEMTGLELIDKITYLPQIIFTTGNKDYAFDAYEHDVTDFLKKPINPNRFKTAIEKAVNRQVRLNAVANYSAGHELYVKTDGKLIRLSFDDILYFENVGDYVKIISTKGTFVIYAALKAIDEKLKHPCFLKVHRSFIVNLNKIKDIEENTLVIEKKVIPISRAFKPIIMRSINIL